MNKKLINLCVLVLVAIIGQKAMAEDVFFECSGFEGVEENRVGINLTQLNAGFFDNDSTTDLQFKSSFVKKSRGMPAQKIFVFESNRAAQTAYYVVYFNYKFKKASLFRINENGMQHHLGTANCYSSTPWSK